MNVPFNKKTQHIYETVARIAREIEARDRKADEAKKPTGAA